MGEFDDNPEFQKLLAGRDDVDLVQFVLELAADAYPQLDRMGCLLEIDRLGVACCDHQSQRRASCTRSRLVATSQLLYEIEGFHGNCEGYYEAQNSYLNDVLAAPRNSHFARHPLHGRRLAHRFEDVRRQRRGSFRRRLCCRRRTMVC